MRKHEKTLPKSLQQQNHSEQNCTSEHFEFGSIIFNHNIYVCINIYICIYTYIHIYIYTYIHIYIYICIFFSCPSHVATRRHFPTPPKKTWPLTLARLGCPCEAKFPTPSPCKAGLWHGTKDLQTAGGSAGLVLLR